MVSVGRPLANVFLVQGGSPLPSQSANPEFNPARPWLFFALAWQIIRSPRQFYRALPAKGPLAGPLLFLAIAHLVSFLVPAAVVAANKPAALAALVANYVLALGQSLLMGLCIYLALRYFFRVPTNVRAVLRVFCYAGGVWALIWLSLLWPPARTMVFLAVAAAHLYLTMLGLQETLKSPMLWAIGAIILGIVLLMLAWNGLGLLVGRAPAPG